MACMDSTCSIEGCDKPVKARGWCQMHYRRWQRNGHFDLMPKVCQVEDCERPVMGRALCKLHYMRWMRRGDPELVVRPRGTPEQRFWAKVDKTDSCWHWMGARKPDGYGAFTTTAHKVVRVHRFAYEQLVGPIPEGLQIDHLCRNRGCVNPAHLEVVTQQENLQRGDIGKHHATKTHCPRGHPYDMANTLNYASGARACRECGRQRMRDYRASMKEREN